MSGGDGGTIGGKQAPILDEVKVYYLPTDYELKFKKRATCVVHTAMIGNSTFPPCIFSREARYGVYLPSVMNQSQGMIFY